MFLCAHASLMHGCSKKERLSLGYSGGRGVGQALVMLGVVQVANKLREGRARASFKLLDI